MNICSSIVRTLAVTSRSLPLVTKQFSTLSFTPQQILSRSILSQIKPIQVQCQAGLKHVVNPKRRCSHCYMVFDDETTYVFCDKYPRHKQVTRKSKREKRNQMIMSHATNGSKKKNHATPRGSMHMQTQYSLRMDF